MDPDGAGIFGGLSVEALRLSAGAQPGRALRDRAALLVSDQASASDAESEPASASLGVLDESRHVWNGRRAGLVFRPQGVPAAPVGGDDGGWLRRSMVVLCAASVRGSLLGTWPRMGLHHSGAARQFVLQTAQGASMVLREHWVSSHSSSEPADSQLSPGEVPPSGAAVSEREAGHFVLQLQIFHLPPLG